MRAIRLKLELAGETVYGIAFPSEAELEAFCAARGLYLGQPPIERGPSDGPPRRGRPCFDAMLEQAVAEIEEELAACDDATARARVVRRHLAQTHLADEIPKIRTVTAYLAEHPIGKKTGNKSGRKSTHARMRRSGGT